MNVDYVNLEGIPKAQEEQKRQGVEEQSNIVEQRNKVQERKARTHRMIVIGSTLAKYMPELNLMNDNEIRIRVSDLAKGL